MNSRFKFPRRVRIHGGECGAVARALHHEAQEDALMTYERASLVPSRFGESPRIDFNERKQMSTKTTLKRIALVAVSALGFGVLTAVAPANAVRAITGLSVGTPSPARVGITSSTTVTATHVAAASDNFVAAVRIVDGPATSTIVKTDTSTATSGVSISVTSPVTAGSVTYGKGTASVTITQPSSTATSTSFKVDFTPDVAGTYTFLVSTGNSTFTAGDRSASFTITTVGAPTALTLARVGGVVTSASTSTFGALYALSMKDANGNATVLGQFETIDLTISDTTNLDLSDSSFSSTDNVAGSYYVEVFKKSSGTIANGTSTLTLRGNGLLPATLTTNASVTTAATSAAVTTDTVKCTTSTNCSGATGGAATDTAFAANVNGAVSLTIGGLSSDTTAKVYNVNVTDNSSGSAVTYSTTLTLAATTTAGTGTTATITAPAPSADGTVQLSGFGDNVVTLTYQESEARTIAIQGTSSVLSALAGTNKFVALVSDQYGVAMANRSVDVTVTGRNAAAKKSIGVTDANGLVSFSLTDAGTTGTTDSIVFSTTVSAGGTGSATATVNYGTVTVASVAVKGGSTVADTGVAKGTNKTSIVATDNGPEGSRVTITATVKDASGNLLAGVPVTFSVDSGLIYKTAAVDFTTVYTNSAGEAVSYIFDWKTGTQTVTATAGDKSATDYVTWEANTASASRVLSGTVSGNIVSYKVVDRFGNPVNGATITLSRVGSGLFGNGASTQTLTTDKTGTADASYTGDATVVAELATTTQAYDAAGKIGTKALTAAVAGTTKGTGDTLAPAGVGKVELKVALGVDPSTVAANAAADAAAEAIDAANAATDAANLAAEAADAATVAAEEARDAADAATAAVEELATQVATLMAALKAQITTLANTVAKIAKKVKA